MLAHRTEALAAARTRPEWTTWSMPGPKATTTVESTEPISAGSRSRPTSSPASACVWSSSSPTAGRAGARCPRFAIRSRPRSPALVTAAGMRWRQGQRRYLDDFWERADVEIEGDAELQQAVRFALFHTLQSAARTERRAIPAKGLTGPGLRRAHLLGRRGLRSARPHLHRAERCPRRAALAPLHARAGRGPSGGPGSRGRGLSLAHDSRRGVLGLLARRYGRIPHQRRHRRRRHPLPARRRATSEFEREIGLELLVETARLWRSLGHHDARGQFRIDGVTGPDEYSAIADNNVYTNLMAQRNLRARGRRSRAPSRPGPRARTSTPRRAASWRDAADAMLVPYDDELARCILRPRSSPSTRSGTSTGRRSGQVPAAAATSPTTTSIASRSSSRPTW